MRDIDQIIAAVHRRMPDVHVTQLAAMTTGDESQVWWFSLPGVEKNVQIECAGGSIPCFLETGSLHTDLDACQMKLETPAEACDEICRCLEQIRTEAVNADPPACA